MAPRRNTNPHAGGMDVHNLLDLADHDHDFGGPPVTCVGVGSAVTAANILSSLASFNETFTKCCVPNGDCLKSGNEFRLINLEDLSECVRVICNNESCTAGQYMHRECFEAWEQIVLTSLKLTGRARSWSDRQRAQNLWTKKGYDLVFKACGCNCGRGHLRKDLDWTPPLNNNVFGRIDEEATKKKKKRNRNNQKPTLALSSSNNGYHPNSQINQSGGGGGGGAIMTVDLRGRAGSLSSSNGSASPPVSGSSEPSLSPIHSGGSSAKKQTSPTQQLHHQQHQHLHQQNHHHNHHHQQHDQKSKVEIYSERVRSTSGCNGIFSRRLDFSSFNLLPPTRLNSYQVKMEDEGNHGNDETRLFILSSLAQNQKSRVSCILCEEAMLVFDRYPLVDGTFFLSPKQHAPGCIEVKYEAHTQYLTAVCMGCLDGGSNRAIFCRFCGDKWDGSSLVLGTMYSYDIFAAMPCCTERLKCNTCFKFLLYPHQRLNFYSDYSHIVTCPHCATQDAHFVKPLSFCYTKQPIKGGPLP